MNTNFVRAYVCGLVINRSLFFSRTVYSYALVSCVFIVLLHQQVAAQYNPRETPKPAWNGRDPVIHRAGDEPYALYHMASPYPHVRKRPKEICNYYGLYTGMWIPTGRDRILGTHPLLGLEFGQWINRFNWDFNLELQIGATSNPYNVVYYGQTVPTNLYGGSYAGLNLGYSLLSLKRSVLYLTAGIGGTGFTAEKGDDTHDPLNINSFTKNCGLGLQHFGKKGDLFGVMLLYNFVGYQNPGGTPIDGNAVTFRIVFGAFD